MFRSGGQGVFGIPMELQEVTDHIMKECFPPEEILVAWWQGSKEEWNPFEDDEDYDEDNQQLPNVQLRFQVGDAVQCRIGEDPVTGWGAGTVIQVWYREQGWPQGQLAPYKIALNDGRNIFAPQDIPEVIRKDQSGGRRS